MNGAVSTMWYKYPPRISVDSLVVQEAENLFITAPLSRCLWLQLEDFIPDCEEFYKKKHNGRKLYWHHIMSNGVVGGRQLLCLMLDTF